MKAVIALIALAAIALAERNCTWVPKELPCSWNLEVTRKGELGLWERTTMYANGAYFYAESEDYGDNILGRMLVRPDLKYYLDITADKSGSLYLYDGGEVSISRLGENELKLLSWKPTTLMADVSYVATPFTHCEDTKWKGHKVTKYWYDAWDNILVQKAFYADEDGEPVGFEYLSTGYGWITTKYDWGTYCPMSKFSFSRTQVYKCIDDRVYKNGDSDYVMCAAYSVKAALALVLAAVAAALF